MGLTAKDEAFREHQSNRVSECSPHAWPMTRSHLKISENQATGVQKACAEAVERLIRDIDGPRAVTQGYGAVHLSNYHHLRDLLYDVCKRPCDKNPISKECSKINCCCPRCVHAFWDETRPLIVRLWERHRAQMGNESVLASQFRYSNAGVFGLSTPHDIATTELARGYDSCVRAAEKVWASSAVGVPTNLDLMAELGKHVERWCESYSPGPGALQRLAVYAMEHDGAYAKWLRRLQPRKVCHLKDGLTPTFSPQEIVEQVIIPATALITDPPLTPGYKGAEVWPSALFVTITVWADYTGAPDAEASHGWRAWDIFAAPTSALASLDSPAADEIKATTVAIWGANMKLFRPPRQSCTDMWRSRGYDGAMNATLSAVFLTRNLPWEGGGIDPSCLDMSAAVMAIHDCIDFEADVINKTAVNSVLIALYYGFALQSIQDTVYATLAVHWISKSISGQLLYSSILCQAGSVRWGGPVYAVESGIEQPSGNLWTGELTAERIASVQAANILPTTVESLTTTTIGESWHDTVLQLSAQELLESPLSGPGGSADIFNILQLSKGTLTLICCSSCSICSANKRLKLDNWSQTKNSEEWTRIMQAVERVRRTVDGSLQSLNKKLSSDSRPDTINRLSSEAVMTGTMESQYTAALLQALIMEDAFYHGTDLLGYCTGWIKLPE